MGLHKLLYQNIGWLQTLSHFKDAKLVIAWRAAPRLSRTLVTYQYPRPGRTIETQPRDGLSQTARLSQAAVDNFIYSQQFSPAAADFINSPLSSVN